MDDQVEFNSPDNLSDVSVSVSNSRPSTAAETASNKDEVTKAAAQKSTEPGEKRKPEVVQDPYYKAMDYLEEHNIIQFFQKLTAAIVFEKPADPIQFIVDKAEEVAESLNDEQLKKFYKKT